WSPTGHLLFARDGGMLATSFDPVTLKAGASAVNVIAKGALSTTMAGGLGIRLAATGDLLALPNDYQSKRVDAVSRDGASRGLAFPPDRYLNPRVSPDGRRVLVEVRGLRLDVLDLERQTLMRLTPEAPGTTFPIWNQDGSCVVFRHYSTPYFFATD